MDKEKRGGRQKQEGEGNEENKAPRASAVITQQQRERKTSGNNMRGPDCRERSGTETKEKQVVVGVVYM